MRSTRISSRRTARPTTVTAWIRLPSPPSPPSPRTEGTGIHPPCRSHAGNPAKTRPTGAATTTLAVTSPRPGRAGSDSGTRGPLRGLLGVPRVLGVTRVLGVPRVLGLRAGRGRRLRCGVLAGQHEVAEQDVAGPVLPGTL